ncbi:MAG: immunoglobulin [Oscillospiraceae bacterium]|nr:immunoglobulin [Oscillospiraceae bacterium]
MKLSKFEQETIVLYNQEEATASVYTHDPKLISKLKRLSDKHPEKVFPERKEHKGAVSYIVPKSCVSVREPYSDARKLADSLRAKKAGIAPPTRSVCSENE